MTTITRTFRRTLLAATAALALLPAAAHAGYGWFYDSSYDGSNTPSGANQYGFKAVAVNSAAGRVYVVGNTTSLQDYRLIQLDQDLNPIAFTDPSAGGSSEIKFADERDQPQVAVDQSGGPGEGNIYVVVHRTLYGWSSTGAPLPNYPIDLPIGADGGGYSDVAVDSTGKVWLLGQWLEPDGSGGIAGYFKVRAYDASGNPVPNSIGSGAKGDYYQSIGFANDGDLYIGHLFNYRSGQLERWVPSGGSFAPATDNLILDPLQGLDVAVDRSTGNFFSLHHLDTGADVAAYTAGDQLIARIGGDQLANPTAVDVSASTHTLYVVDGPNVKTFIRKSLPDVVTDAPSNATASAMTLNGSVNPQGETITDCHFDWGPGWSGGYGNQLPCVEDPGSGTDPVSVHADLGGLDAGSRYHYRLVASIAGYTVDGDERDTVTVGSPLIGDTYVSKTGYTTVNVHSTVNPARSATTYHIEYGPTSGYGSATAESEPVGSDDADHATAEVLRGLAPGTTYHYRVVATNAEGTTAGADRTFTTFGVATEACANQQFRLGAAAALADCRAYELVTPRDTNGEEPLQVFSCPWRAQGSGAYFNTAMAAPDGDSYQYCLSGTVLDGYPGGGLSNAYQAHRSADGWDTTAAGPSAAEAKVADQSGSTPDGRYQVFEVHPFFFPDGGPLDVHAPSAGALDGSVWLRRPDGGFTLVGLGTVPADPDPDTHQNGLIDDVNPYVAFMSRDGAHLIFASRKQLLPEAPAGTDNGGNVNVDPYNDALLYDRTPDGLKLLSVLTDSSVPYPPTAHVTYAGASADGRMVMFSANGSLYLRYDNQQTLLVAASGATTRGVSADGHYAFYRKGGNLFRYSIDSDQTDQLTTSGDADVIWISADGSTVYLTSPSQLDGSLGTPGQPNLYVWHAGDPIRFIATPAADDPLVATTPLPWAKNLAVNTGFTTDPARTNDDGSVFVFESRATLTDYDARGHNEVYRYERGSGQITCVSCASSNDVATGDARLVRRLQNFNQSIVPNVTQDGRTVFFESTQQLVPGDTNSKYDVYEWHDGKISLISSGQSSADSELMGMTDDGHDVFFKTDQALVPNSQESGIQAVYDARVNGGIASQHAIARPPCDPAACRPASPPPGDIEVGAAHYSSGQDVGQVTKRPAKAKLAVRVRHFKGSRLLLTVKTSVPGRLHITGHGLKRVRKKLAKARSYHVTVHLTRAGARALRRHHRLRISGVARLSASGGRKASDRFRTVAKRRAPSHRRR